MEGSDLHSCSSLSMITSVPTDYNNSNIYNVAIN